jgi:serine/threonine-protein kinase
MSVEKIGRYQVSDELGKGAMGVVYKASDPTIGRTVALKTMRLDVHAEKHDAMLRRFQHEARAAGRLSHPNIVTIYDAGEAEGIFYIAMECIEGTTLASMLHKRRALSALEIVEIGTQICAGLQYAHFRKVVHRDIKPQNIMLAAGGAVKIMDFGIAKAGASLTHTGEVLGTPHYMSPEQVKGQDLDGRSDIFSLGVVLYEMVTGEKPFTGQNVTAVVYQIVNEEPVPPRELDVSIHPGLSMIITKCLAKDPEDRYQEAGDLATALKSYKIVSIPQAHGVSDRKVPIPIPVPPPRAAITTPPAATSSQTAKPITMAQSAAASKPGLMPGSPPLQATAKEHSGGSPARRTITLFVALAVVLAGSAIALRKYRTYSFSPASSQARAPAQPVAPEGSKSDSPEQSSRQAAQDGPDSSKSVAEPPEKASNTPTLAAGVGDLRITSNPPGAQVSIDGATQDYYVTPFNSPPMKAGRHVLLATIAGLAPQTREVEVAPRNRVNVDFQLSGDKAIYNINSAPAGAEVLIDGTPVGARTPIQIALTAGTHKIALRLDGFDPVEINAQGAAGESVNLAPRLPARNSVNISEEAQGDAPSLGALARMRRPETAVATSEGKGAVVIRTRPRGVTIVVDGYRVPRTTPTRLPVKAGSHTVVLQKPGFQSVTRVVEVEEGKVTEIDELLPRQ